jgi:hypothetical protein
MPAPLNVVRGTRFGCVPKFHSVRLEDKDGAAPFLALR